MNSMILDTIYGHIMYVTSDKIIQLDGGGLINLKNASNRNIRSINLSNSAGAPPLNIEKMTNLDFLLSTGRD